MAWEGPGWGQGWNFNRDEQARWDEWACGRCGTGNFLHRASCRQCGKLVVSEVLEGISMIGLPLTEAARHGAPRGTLAAVPDAAASPPTPPPAPVALPAATSPGWGVPHPPTCPPSFRQHGQPRGAHSDLGKAVQAAAVGASCGAPSAGGPNATAGLPGEVAAGPTWPQGAAEGQSGGQEKQAEPMATASHWSRPLPVQVSPGRPHGQHPEAHGDLQEAVPRAAVSASGAAPSAVASPDSETDIQAAEEALAMELELNDMLEIEQGLVGIRASTAHKQKLLVERFRQAHKRADDACQGLASAQRALSKARQNYRAAREKAATARTAFSSASEEVAVLYANEETEKPTANLVTTIRKMVEALQARNMSQLVVQAALAEALLIEEEQLVAASSEPPGSPEPGPLGQTHSADSEAACDKNAGNSEGPHVWKNEDEDMQAAERLPALREQRGRSRTPPPRGTSVAELTDRLEDEA